MKFTDGKGHFKTKIGLHGKLMNALSLKVKVFKIHQHIISEKHVLDDGTYFSAKGYELLTDCILAPAVNLVYNNYQDIRDHHCYLLSIYWDASH